MEESYKEVNFGPTKERSKLRADQLLGDLPLEVVSILN